MTGSGSPKRTALYGEHVRAGGKMVPFAGFAMPVQFASIQSEHERVRSAVGLFDVSHMGEVFFRGPRAREVVQQLTTNDVGGARPGRAVYTPVCRPDGGIVDDMIFYRLSDDEFLACVNASNRHKDVAWFVAQNGGRCEVSDESDDFSQIAVQGPNGPELLRRVFGPEVSALKPFSFVKVPYRGGHALVATTGYTGERGGEVYLPNDLAVPAWTDLVRAGEDLGVGPIGLGARDTLRMEMQYCLYGNDIDDTTTPVEASIGWTVKPGKGDFTGRDVLVSQLQNGPGRRLVSMSVEGKGIPRHGYPILAGGREIGHVTSGTLSPSLRIPIALGYVERPYAEVGTKVEIDLKGLKTVVSRVAEAPLYRRPN
jgi:aminomethyltransferase